MAPWAPLPLVAVTEFMIGRLGGRTPVLSSIVRGNLRAAGLYSPEVFEEYFQQVAQHLCNGVRIFHDPGATATLAKQQIELDASISYLTAAREAGRGVLLAPAHTVNFVLTLARLNQEVPICIFLRWSSDSGKLRMKRDWCEACGLRVVMEPARSMSATTRAAICVDELRTGSILAITPDVAQKAADGAGVRVFDRTAYLPTGAAAIAQLAESPIVPLFGRLEESAQTLYCQPAYQVERVSREEGGRKAALQNAMQTWASQFEAFVKKSPAAWFFWGDRSWTRVFRGDPKYCNAEARGG